MRPTCWPPAAIGNFLAKAFYKTLMVDESVPSIQLNVGPSGFTLNIATTS